MLTAIVAPENRAVLWAALPTLPVSWTAVPQAGVTLPGGLAFTHRHAPDGTLDHLQLTLYASESLEALLDGRGPYTEEELEDPHAVIGEYEIQAQLRVDALTVEAAVVLGLPSVMGQPDWFLPDRTISLGLARADTAAPVEVCVWLLPPGRTAAHLHG